MADKISNFAKTIYPEVLKGLKKKGYNTDLADIITSQMAMESDYGKYDKIGSFNITGTKWFPTMTNRDYVVNPDDGIKYANFKSYEDQVDFYLANIKNKWGEKAFKAKNSKEWAEALHPKKGQKYSASDAKDYEKRITGLTSLQKEINNLYKNEDPFSGKSYHPSINNELITSNSSIEGPLDEALEMIFEEEDEEDAMLALAEQFQEEEDDEIEEELFGSNEEAVVDTEDPKTKEEVEEKATERDLIQEALNKRAEQYAMIESMFTLGEEDEEDEYFLQMGGEAGLKGKLKEHEDLIKVRRKEVDRLKRQNPIKGAYLDMKERQDNDPNWFSRTARKVITSPLHVGSYLHDLADSNNTRDMLTPTEKRNSNVDGLDSILDVVSLARFGVLKSPNLYEGALLKEVVHAVPKTNLVRELAKEAGSQVVQDGIVDEVKKDNVEDTNRLIRELRTYQEGGNIDTRYFREEDIEIFNNNRADSRELNSLLSLVLKSNKTPKRLGRLNRKKIENNFT